MGFFCEYFVKNYQKKWILGTCIVFYRSHWSHGHSNIQLALLELSSRRDRWRLHCFGLNRFGGVPGGGPVTSIGARDRFFGTCLFGVARGMFFLGIRGWGFGFGLMARSSLLYLLRAFALVVASSLGSQLLHIRNLLRLSLLHHWKHLARGASLSSIGWEVKLLSILFEPWFLISQTRKVRIKKVYETVFFPKKIENTKYFLIYASYDHESWCVRSPDLGYLGHILLTSRKIFRSSWSQ